MKRRIGLCLIIFFIIIVLASLVLAFINKKITPTILNYSEEEIKRIATIIVNKSITDKSLNKEELDNIFVVNRNNDGEYDINLDSIIVNKILNRISDACENNLRLIENREFDKLEDFDISENFFYVPLGIIFSNSFFSNHGPLIPIKLKIIGNVTSNINTEIKEYGINNSLITISVSVKVELSVILPLTSKKVDITNSVPIVIRMIEGKIPAYYSRT